MGTETDMPAYWAATQNNLGNVLQIFGDRLGGEPGSKKLIEAVTAYEASLRVFTKADMPGHWARVQNSIDKVMRKLAR
jgi:hypothetical protein